MWGSGLNAGTFVATHLSRSLMDEGTYPKKFFEMSTVAVIRV